VSTWVCGGKNVPDFKGNRGVFQVLEEQVEAVGGVMEELVEAVGGGRRWRQEVEELCLLLGLFWWKHLLLFDMCGG